MTVTFGEWRVIMLTLVSAWAVMRRHSHAQRLADGVTARQVSIDMDSQTLIALGGFFTALVTAIVAIPRAMSAYRTAQLSAKRSEVTLLRAEVMRLSGRVDELSVANARLQDENTQLRSQMVMLQIENALLRQELSKRGIEIPKMPRPSDVVEPADEAAKGNFSHV